jgi:4,5-DOPA dioxygenase extradiol
MVDVSKKAAMMPALFVGHGSPMNALERNRYTEAWRAFGAGVPRPRAILAISAHWYVNATAITAMGRPRTIHDFYGVPPELFAVEYPAPGDPALAAEIVETVKPAWIGLDEDSWGIDHGTWSVLVHMFPRADIPVLQLSINALEPFAYHVALGRRLAPLRERGVLIVASGNVVHNLRRIDGHQPDAAFAWNRRFDEAAKEIMISNPAGIARLQQHPDFALAAPTPEHFMPLLYLAGLAAASASTAEPLIEGYAMGSLSMTAYTLGLQTPLHINGNAGNPPLGSAPPDQSNL